MDSIRATLEFMKNVEQRRILVENPRLMNTSSKYSIDLADRLYLENIFQCTICRRSVERDAGGSTGD